MLCLDREGSLVNKESTAKDKQSWEAPDGALITKNEQHHARKKNHDPQR